MTTEQKETLVKELDFSAEKGKEEMARMREGMAELLDERVGDCVLLVSRPLDDLCISIWISVMIICLRTRAVESDSLKV